VLPPAPQAIASLPIAQVLPLQHPVGHELVSQTQAPLEHLCPAPHMLFGPQWQVPPAQLSARLASHALQVAPCVPHAAEDGVTQLPAASQQPLGQLVELQLHLPETHCWPVGHALDMPQPHAFIEQWSVLPSVVQSLQTAPPEPHWVSLPDWQTPLKQQPLGQLCASQPEQVPPPQVLPPGQV
jgi:hypothetical protein